MENLKNNIVNLAAHYHKEIIDIRRHLHKHPELSQQEFETAYFISQKLSEYGINHQAGVGKTGVVGIIKGEQGHGQCIALRADTDALPISETNKVYYSSIKKNIMHACGHDFHIASLLGTAKILNELKHSFKGTVKLIFQPSEELYPGGARMMIKDGVLENPRPDAIIAQHVIPQLETGHIGITHNACMASTDEIHLTINGKGGHAAMPHNCVDTILIASHIVVALQQIVSRQIDPNSPAVLTLGNFEAKGRTNVIPNKATISGTLRTYDKTSREIALDSIHKISTGIAQAMGATCNVEMIEKYPVLINSDNVVELVETAAKELLPDGHVHHIEHKMTAEDFAIFAEQIPACFYRVGTGNQQLNTTNELHTPNFDVDDSALINSTSLMAYTAIKYLNTK